MNINFIHSSKIDNYKDTIPIFNSLNKKEKLELYQYKFYFHKKNTIINYFKYCNEVTTFLLIILVGLITIDNKSLLYKSENNLNNLPYLKYMQLGFYHLINSTINLIFIHSTQNNTLKIQDYIGLVYNVFIIPFNILNIALELIPLNILFIICFIKKDKNIKKRNDLKNNKILFEKVKNYI